MLIACLLLLFNVTHHFVLQINYGFGASVHKVYACDRSLHVHRDVHVHVKVTILDFHKNIYCRTHTAPLKNVVKFNKRNLAYA